MTTLRRFALTASLLVASSTALACSGAMTIETDNGPAPVDSGKPEAEPPVEDSAPPVEETAPPADAGKPEAEAPPPLCPAASGVYNATPSPHDVLFLLDRSGSMHAKVASGATRWAAATSALSSLLDAIDPAATRAGLDMFPRGDKPITCCWINPKTNYTTCSCASGELPTTAARCNVASYSPSLVPVTTLGDAQKAAIRTGMHKSDAEFYWGTPMKFGLQSAIAKQASLDLDGVRSVVLITDGEPTSCNSIDDKIDAVVAVADAGTKLAKPVKTYVVGVIDAAGDGANAASLSRVAVAGGTPRSVGCEATNSCFYAANAKTFETDLAKAFVDIELKAFACTFDVPTMSSGSPDYDLVNVTLTKPGGIPTTLGKDVTHKDGWDFIDGNTKVQLYGTACGDVKADAKTTLQVVVGCKTIKK